MLNELFHLLTKEEVIARLIDLMQTIGNSVESNRSSKNLCTLNQRDKTDILHISLCLHIRLYIEYNHWDVLDMICTQHPCIFNICFASL